MNSLEALNAVQRRVLGVLIEKALAQPQYYPMSVNAVMVAANQKNNRDPEMNLDEESVFSTLETLRTTGIVSRVMPGSGSRVERYRHEIKELLAWEKPQRAVMAELLLRGPQTVGELRTRCTRMYPFENTDSVQAVLDGLAGGERPWVAKLARLPGQSAPRYAHRLYTAKEWEALQASASAEAAAGPASAGSSTGGAAISRASELNAGGEPEVAALWNEIASLRDRVAALEARLSDVQRTS